MKAVKANLFRKVKVVTNTDRSDRPQWAKIVVDGKIAHTGQLKYIKGVAKAKYNLLAKI